MTSATTSVCGGFDTQVERVWGGKVKAQIEAASTKLGVDMGASAYERVLVKMDEISADWVRLRGQLCRDQEAGRVTNVQYQARSLCMDGALLRMRTLSTMLERGGLTDVDAMMRASDTLDQRLATCGEQEDANAPSRRGLRLHSPPANAEESRVQQLDVDANGDPVKMDASAVYGRSVAVVVGINAYDQMPHLKAAEADALSVAAQLSNSGFEVHKLLGKDASRERITALLGDQLPLTLREPDRVLVFFAGHGVSVGAESHAMGYLMPRDAKREAPIATGISMAELQAWLGGYPAKHVMFVADACYSGLALPNRGVSSTANAQRLQLLTRERVRYTLVAGQDNQEAWEMRTESQGAFTHYFLAALAGEADSNGDVLVTADEITAYVTDRVFRYVWDNYRAEQRPTSARSGRGEFVFFVNSEVVAGDRLTSEDL